MKTLYRCGRSILLVAVAAGCGSKGGPSGPGETPAIHLALGAANATIDQGASSLVGATLTRSGGFTGAVAFTVEGAPAGVTGTVSNIQNSGSTTTASVTMDVGLNTPVGVYNLTVRAQGSGVTDVTVPFGLTVALAPGFTLAPTPPALTIVQGGNAPTTIALTRTNFTGSVALTLEGAPAGLTGAFVPASTSDVTSVLTVSAAASVPAGVYNLTVRGAAPPLQDRTTPLQVTVTALPSYSLSLTPPDLTIQQGGNAPTTVNVTRTNFTGAVTLSLAGAPAGVTGVFAPPAPTTDASVLTVTVGAGVATGVYPLMVNGTGSAGDHGTPLTLTVTAAPIGSGTLDFNGAGCFASDRAIFVAVQNGNGPWTRVTGTGDVYHFDFTAGKGGVAYVSQVFGTTNSLITVKYLTRAEQAVPITPCLGTGTKTVQMSITNIGAANMALVTLGSGAQVINIDGTYPILNVNPGPQDLFVVRHKTGLSDPTDGSFRMVARHGLNIAAGASIGATVDMAAEGFDLITALMSVSGATGGETLQQTMTYSDGTCKTVLPYVNNPVTTPGSFTGVGVAPANALPNELHALTVTGQIFTTGPSRGNTRLVTEYFHTFGPRALVLPPRLPDNSIVHMPFTPGQNSRWQTSFPRAPEYDGPASLLYGDATVNGHRVLVTATSAWIGGAANVVIGDPDLSGLPGWVPTWGATTVVPVGFTIGISNAGPNVCKDGGRLVQETQTGQTP